MAALPDANRIKGTHEVRVIVPGRTYRVTSDATHSPVALAVKPAGFCCPKKALAHGQGFHQYASITAYF